MVTHRDVAKGMHFALSASLGAQGLRLEKVARKKENSIHNIHPIHIVDYTHLVILEYFQNLQ